MAARCTRQISRRVRGVRAQSGPSLKPQGGAAISRRAGPIRPGLARLGRRRDAVRLWFWPGRFCARGGEPHPQPNAGAAASRLRRRAPRRLHESADRVRAGHGGYYAR
jgi:hypothetical protein